MRIFFLFVCLCSYTFAMEDPLKVLFRQQLTVYAQKPGEDGADEKKDIVQEGSQDRAKQQIRKMIARHGYGLFKDVAVDCSWRGCVCKEKIDGGHRPYLLGVVFAKKDKAFVDELLQYQDALSTPLTSAKEELPLNKALELQWYKMACSLIDAGAPVTEDELSNVSVLSKNYLVLVLQGLDNKKIDNKEKRQQLAEKLIDRGCDVNADYDGAFKGYVELGGITPFIWAVAGKYNLQTFLRYANFDYPSPHILPPVHYMAACQFKEGLTHLSKETRQFKEGLTHLFKEIRTYNERLIFFLWCLKQEYPEVYRQRSSVFYRLAPYINLSSLHISIQRLKLHKDRYGHIPFEYCEIPALDPNCHAVAVEEHDNLELSLSAQQNNQEQMVNEENDNDNEATSLLGHDGEKTNCLSKCVII